MQEETKALPKSASASNDLVQTDLTTITEELKRKAAVCETIAQDKTEAALTGASCEKELNEEHAKAWRLKSQVWGEAEAIVRAGGTGESPAPKPEGTV